MTVENHFERLPRDMYSEIFQWLPAHDWVALRMVCRAFYAHFENHLGHLPLPALWIRDSAALEDYDRQVLVPSPLLYRMADADNTAALFALGMFSFWSNTERTVSYFIDYFRQTNELYKLHNTVILDAAELRVASHRCNTLAYIHTTVCFHIRVALFFECECCLPKSLSAYAKDDWKQENGLVRAAFIGQVLDRLHKYYNIYDTVAADEYCVELVHCTSERRYFANEYSLASTMDGMLLDELRSRVPEFPSTVIYEHVKPYVPTFSEALHASSLPSSPTYYSLDDSDYRSL